MFEMTKRTLMLLPLNVSSSMNSPRRLLNSPMLDGGDSAPTLPFEPQREGFDVSGWPLHFQLYEICSSVPNYPYDCVAVIDRPNRGTR
jgi:hypothetical protein